MRPGLILVLLSSLFLSVSASAVQNDSLLTVRLIDDLSHKSGKIGTYHALIIGIKEYMDPKIPDLETPLNDAHMMADLLKNKYGFSVETILDKNATRKSIYNSLRDLTSKVKQNDSVLIYYAGHGDLDRQYNDGWWIPSDAKAGDPTTYLENVQVQKAMRSMKARHVLLISDSCYAGTLFGQTRALPLVIENKYYLNLYNLKSRWGLTSGNKTPVTDDGTEGHSIFAYQLLKELRKNNRPYLSIQEIYTSIAPVISNNSEQIPLCRPIKNTGDMGGQFVFILYKDDNKRHSIKTYPNQQTTDVAKISTKKNEISKLIGVWKRQDGPNYSRYQLEIREMNGDIAIRFLDLKKPDNKFTVHDISWNGKILHFKSVFERNGHWTRKWIRYVDSKTLKLTWENELGLKGEKTYRRLN